MAKGRYREEDPEERYWREPDPIQKVLNQYLARTGFGRVRTADQLREAWNAAVGELFAKQTSPGTVRRGVLEIRVAASIFAQELTFRKAEILKKLQQLLPGSGIRDLRFKTF
ncbi:MAG: DUF721 domain-containing protein [Thermoguttaceae bacterium]|nr:DUF721 domain-containing protein [Thermoguttaceae bacterium]